MKIAKKHDVFFQKYQGVIAPSVLMIRDWRTRFLQTLRVSPRSHAGDQSNHRTSNEKVNEIIGAFGDYLRTAQRKVALQCETSLSTVNKVSKREKLRP